MRNLITAMALLLYATAHGFAESSMTVNLRGKDQTLHLYGDNRNPPLILSSGDLGWAGLVVHVAEFLSARGYYIIGFNTKAYLTSFTTRASALDSQDVPRDYRSLIDIAAKGSQSRPLLAGISEGAGLSVLASTDPGVKNAIQGVLALGLPDENELGWKWQDFTIWITKKIPDEPSFRVRDIIDKVAPTPLAEIHSTHDEFLPLEAAKALLAKGGEPKKMWIVEASNHRFSSNRDELDRCMLEALDWIKKSR